MRNTVRIELLGPEKWRPLMAAAFRALSPEAARTAGAILSAMHNRHIGITPDLSAGLARILLGAEEPVLADDALVAVGRRLMGGIGGVNPHIAGFSSRSRFGLLVGAGLSYLTIRLFTPLIRSACGEIGQSILFSEENQKAEPPDYAVYAEQLSAKIIELADPRRTKDNLFWKDRALALLKAARDRQRESRPRPDAIRPDNIRPEPLPEADPLSLGVFLRMKPRLSLPHCYLQLKGRKPAALEPRRYRVRPAGGIEGIHRTRRMEHLDKMLVSEFMHDDFIFIDRLVNTGFLAYQRRPQKDKLNDIGVTAVMPKEVRPCRDIIKACWFECLVRLSPLLIKCNRTASEFRWIENDAFGGERTDRFDLRRFRHRTDSELDELFRREFMTALGWLPDFLDARRFSGASGFAAAGGTGLPSAARRADNAANRARSRVISMWKSRAGTHGGMQPGRNTVPRSFSDEYLMIFLPLEKFAGRIKTRAAGDHGAFLKQFKNVRACITHAPVWHPKKEERELWLKEWRFEAAGHSPVPLIRSAGGRSDIQEFAGRLVRCWLEYLVEDMF